MADFSSYPALDIQQMASPLDMAGKAAALNGQLLQNTGMGLTQHYTRLSAMARAGASLLNPDGTADPATVKNSITDMVKNGIITASEGATALTSIPNDPKMAGQKVRELLAGVGNNLDAVTAHMGYQSSGDGFIPYQDHALAPGGVNMPTIHSGVSPEFANTKVDVPNADGSTTVTTQGQAATSLGGNPNSSIAGQDFNPKRQPAATPLAPAQPIAASPLPASGPQIAAQTLAAIAPPQNAMTAQRGATPNPMAPATGPINIPAAAPEIWKQNTGFYTDDIKAGNDPSLAASISNLQGIVAGSDSAVTGAGGSWRQALARAGNYLGMDIASDAPDREIMTKESGMLAQQLGSMGQQTDAGALQQLHITPNADMTPGAIKATAALTMGLLQYKVNMAKAAQDWTNQNGQAAIGPKYNEFRQQYLDQAPSPLVLALPNMPRAQQESVIKYVKSLPDAQKAKFWNQLQAGK